MRGSPTRYSEFEAVSHDGFKLAVQVSGSFGAPALLLLPGQANSHRWWNGLREDFDADFLTVTFDYRGTGRSRGPIDAWSTRTFAEDAACVLRALAIDSAGVYGTSMGGRVAQMLAVTHPDLVSGLVLACTSPGGSHAVEPTRAIMQTFVNSNASERLRAIHSLFYSPDWPLAPSESTLLGDASMSRQEATAHRRVSQRHDAWNELARISAPTLVLHGDDDELTPPQNAKILAERIPHSRMRTYPGGRHGFFEEFRGIVSSDILDFLGA